MTRAPARGSNQGMCHPGPLPTRRPRPQPQAWDFDALGNWDSLTIDGGSPQTRTHNKQNEITAVSGATSPTFDANGNMTTDETGKQYVYDAWNRLKVVKNLGGTTLKTYVYDAMGRRVAETAGGANRDHRSSVAQSPLQFYFAAGSGNPRISRAQRAAISIAFSPSRSWPPDDNGGEIGSACGRGWIVSAISKYVAAVKA